MLPAPSPLITLLLAVLAPSVMAQPNAVVPRFERPESGLVLARPTHAGTFFDVLGRRAAVFGYEGRPFEVWTYPLKLAGDVQLDFAIEDYPVPIDGLDAQASIEVRPEATTMTYAHAAFSVEQTLFAPLDEAGVVMLLDVDTVRPLTVSVSFRPDLALMWPAGLMTGFLGWDAPNRRYFIGEETQRYYGIVGSPLAEDVSVQPYQEEPADLPTTFELRVTPEVAEAGLIPVVFAGSTEGRAAAEATYERLLANAPALYRETAEHYARLQEETLQIDTPDDRLDAAFAWAKVGIDKGLVTNPDLGTGFVAGFRTAGRSERPGFAWFFGRDALWTALATTAYGDFAATRTALDFLRPFQRADGKIPHEVSQSAALLDWFDAYPYAWASADATPLFVIVHADLWRATGDVAFLRRHWDALKAAYAFTAATDRDGNGLIENTGVGHGWVEGGQLYPPHEELYMQGLWIEASQRVAAMADALGDGALAAAARRNAERTRAATEATYWLPDEGFYAVATHFPDATSLASDEGEQASTGLARGVAAERAAEVMAENTAMQGVPFWWHTLDAGRVQRGLDALGGGALATDWGARILDATSDRYDPLSYHNGSVWPLFTGWVSMGAYAYGRPHIGYQALMASALLTEQDALGYVTELLSGDYNAAFGRSSHHQVWSEAMVATPAVAGLLGLDVRDGGRTLHFAPQLPADWDSVGVEHVSVGDSRYDFALTRRRGELRVEASRRSGSGGVRFELAPAFPLDAHVRAVLVGGEGEAFEIEREGDVQRAVLTTELRDSTEIVFRVEEGSAAFVRPEAPLPGATSRGLRILRDRAENAALRLVLEGVGGRTYTFGVRTPQRIASVPGVTIRPSKPGFYDVDVTFDGAPGHYVRRVVTLPLHVGG